MSDAEPRLTEVELECDDAGIISRSRGVARPATQDGGNQYELI